jgi:hypothetical protein
LPTTVASLGPGFFHLRGELLTPTGLELRAGGIDGDCGAAMRFSNRAEYLPTRRQIVAACAAIRSQWTPAERRRRTVDSALLSALPTWTPPQIAIAHCTARVRKMIAEVSA